MKKYILLFCLLIAIKVYHAQFNIGSNTNNPYAVLQLQGADSSQGFIVPYVTTANRPSPSDTTQGMLIYNLNDSVLQYCDGVQWISISNNGLNDNDWVRSNDTLYSAPDSMVFIGNGKVGIGTIAPNHTMHITAPTNTLGVLLDRQTSSFNAPFTVFDGFYAYSLGRSPLKNPNNSSFSIFKVHHNLNFQNQLGNFYFESGAGSPYDTIVVFTSGGRVGINTISPAHQLHVVSSSDPVKFEGLQNDVTLDTVITMDTAGVLHKRALSSIADSIASLVEDNDWTLDGSNLYSGPDSTMFIKPNYVGIGTTNPLHTLHIKRTGTPQSNNVPIRLDLNYSSALGTIQRLFETYLTEDGDTSYFGIKSTGQSSLISSNGDMNFRLNSSPTTLGTTFMTAYYHPSSGKTRVNIGSNSSALSAQLGVYGDGATNRTLALYSSNDPSTIFFTAYGPTKSISISEESSPVSNTRLYIRGAGNSSVTDALSIVNSDSLLLFKVRNNGNVGVGTTAPSAKLHVHNDVSGNDSAFVVTNRGYTGIGTSSPISKLDIKSNGGTQMRLEKSTTNDVLFSVSESNGYADVYIRSNYSAPSFSSGLTVDNYLGENIVQVHNSEMRFGNNSTYNRPHITTSANAGLVQDLDATTWHLFSWPNETYYIGAAIGSYHNTQLDKTTGHFRALKVYQHFNPAVAGTAQVSVLEVGGSMNQSSGATGILRGIYVNPTLTSIADYRAIHMANNNANSYGVYQSGSLTKNYFAGKVGLGTSSPDTTLHIVGSIKIEDGNQANGYVLQSDANGLGTWVDPSTITAADDGDWIVDGDTLYSAPDSTVVIKGGNVGIGTTSPETLMDVMGRLTVGDRIITRSDGNRNTYINFATDLVEITAAARPLVTSKLGGSGYEVIINEDGVNNDFRVESDNDSYSFFVQGSDGNIGIGTSSPDTTLHIIGSIKIEDGNEANGYVLQSDANGVGTWVDPTTITTADDGDWVLDADTLYSAPDSAVVIKGGNVGIGSSDPAKTLDIVGAASISDRVYVGDPGTVSAGSIGVEEHVSIRRGNLRISSQGVAATSTSGSIPVILSESGRSARLSAYNDIQLIPQGDEFNTAGGVYISNAPGGTAQERLHVNASGDSLQIDSLATGVLSNVLMHNPTTGKVISGSISAISDSIAQMVDTDGDTKIQVEESADEDKIRFDTKGVERMIIDDNGNVGIGTSTPITPLQVNDTNPSIRLTNENGQNQTNTGRLEFMESNSLGMIQTYDGSADRFHISSIISSVEHERITIIRDNGNVGIGTTAPLARLHLDGGNMLINDTLPKIRFTHENGSNQSNNGLIEFMESATFGMNMSYDGSTDKFYISGLNGGPETDLLTIHRNDGNVGINTSSPVGKFHIHNDASGVDSAFVVTASGNVGIGTTDPGAKMEIKSTIATIELDDSDGVAHGSINSRILFNASGANQGAIGYQTIGGNFSISTNDDFFFLNGSGYDYKWQSGTANADDQRMIISSAGNLGIGVGNPSAQFHIMNDNSGSDSAFVVTSAGNVGVGTINPGAPLEVRSDVNGVSIIKSDMRAAVNNKGIELTATAIGNSSYWIYATATDDAQAFLVRGDGRVSIGSTSSLGPLFINNDQTGSDSSFIFTDRGYLGLGTTSPSKMLHVSASSDPVKLEGLQNDATLDTIITVDEDGILHKTAMTAANYSNVSSISSATTLTVSNEVVLADASSGGFTITLPTAVGNTGKRLEIKKSENSANVIVIDGDGAETIDGAASVSLTAAWQKITLISDGSNWFLL